MQERSQVYENERKQMKGGEMGVGLVIEEIAAIDRSHGVGNSGTLNGNILRDIDLEAELERVARVEGGLGNW